MIHELFNLIATWARKQARRTWVIVGIAVAVIVYIVLWTIPRPVQLSYASERTCIPWITILPGVQSTVGNGKFAIVTEGGLKIGSISLVSTNTCITPMDTPIPGRTTVALAPLGGWLFQQRINVAVGAPPSVRLTTRAPVPVSQPLKLALSLPDILSRYQLAIDGKNTTCQLTAGKRLLSCSLTGLELKQGRQYPIEMLRSFKSSKPTSILKATITTLQATTITGGSVSSNEVVYTQPTEFTFTTDKPLNRATVMMTQGNANSTTIPVTTSTSGNTITVKLADALPREKTYTLTITNVEAVDGSSLVEPYTVSFSTSGGPKVTSVSVGSFGVATNARVAVTFDQPLSDSQDVSTAASITGVAAHIERDGNQIIYTLSAGLCTPFTLSVASGLQSNYGVTTTTGWSYSSRTVCHVTSVYGYSVQGRPLVSYTFGTGGPLTMYVGAIHGNEPSSSGLMQAWVNDLEANPSLYTGKRVVVVPTINPDGVAANTRMNADHVNLNRNFPTDGWVSDINDTDGYHAGGGGPEPLSEPESKALATLTISLRPRLLLSFHAQGSLVTGDPGGYSAAYAAEYASMVGYNDTTYSAGGGFDYNITGAYEDWASSKEGIPSMVIELGSYTYYSFVHHQAALRAMLN